MFISLSQKRKNAKVDNITKICYNIGQQQQRNNISFSEGEEICDF